MDLFMRKDFTSHSGHLLTWKIECDALTEEEIETLALIISERLQFGDVIGIPSGGLRIASALEPYKTEGPTLIVDDVLTTGKSMEKVKEQYPDAIGVVLFSRTQKLPEWITSVFTLSI